MGKGRDDIVAEVERLREVYKNDPSQSAVLGNLFRIAGLSDETPVPADKPEVTTKSSTDKVRTD